MYIKIIIGAILSTTCISIYAQNQLSVNATSIGLKIKDPQNRKRLKESATKFICGYYSSADSNFYDCKGNAVAKIKDRSVVKDGDGCCEEINLTTGQILVIGTLDAKLNNEIIIKNSKEEYKVLLNDKEAEQFKAELLKSKLKSGSKVNLKVNL